MQPKRVLIDLDSTIVDILTPWLASYNSAHGDSLAIEDITSWDMHENAKAGHAIYDVLTQPGFFRSLRPYPGAVEAVERISKLHNVFIVTTASPGPSASEKLDWCQTWLPFLNKRRVIITHAKELIPADVLVDDAPHNAVAYRDEHPDAEIYGLLFPYNRNCNAFTALFYGFDMPERAWADISERLGAE